MRKFLAMALCLALLTACGGGDGSSDSTSPVATTQPTKDLTYTSGTADVAVSGAEDVAFAAPLDPDMTATYTAADGFDVWWRTGDQALNLSGNVVSGEPDVFVRVETGPTDQQAYVDPFHTECDVQVTSFDDTQLAGTFTCTDLPAFAGKTEADVTGTFTATV